MSFYLMNTFVIYKVQLGDNKRIMEVLERMPAGHRTT